MNPACCKSPLVVGHLPPIVEAGIAIALMIVFAMLMHLGWKWMSSPAARHAALTCNRLSCQLCIDEERNARVDQYVTQARERKARNA